MFTYDWKLALVMLAILPLYALTYFIANRINKKYQSALMERSAYLSGGQRQRLAIVGTLSTATGR